MWNGRNIEVTARWSDGGGGGGIKLSRGCGGDGEREMWRTCESMCGIGGILTLWSGGGRRE